MDIEFTTLTEGVRYYYYSIHTYNVLSMSMCPQKQGTLSIPYSIGSKTQYRMFFFLIVSAGNETMMSEVFKFLNATAPPFIHNILVTPKLLRKKR